MFKFNKMIFICCLIMLSTVSAFAYTVRSGHPRVYINPDNIEILRSRAINYDDELYVFLANGSMAPYGNVANWLSNPQIDDSSGHRMLILAYFYQMNKDGMLNVPGVAYGGNTATDYGNVAVTMLMYNLGLGNWSSTKYSLVYDWCWDLMTTTQKSDFAQLAVEKEGKEGELNGGSTGNEWTGNPSTVYRGRAIIPGLALYGDNIVIDVSGTGYHYTNSDQAAIVYCDIVENRWKTHVIPAGNMSASNDGGWGSGLSYGTSYMHGYVEILEAWRTATGETEIYSDNNRMRYSPQWWLYNSKVYTGKTDGISANNYNDIPGLVVEDCHKTWGQAQLSHSYLSSVIAAIGNTYNLLGDTDTASLCEWMLTHKTYSLLEGVYSVTGPHRYGVYYMLWHDGSIRPKSPTSLTFPLTKIFGDADDVHRDNRLGVTRRAGTGWVVMRTNWDDENALQLAFRASSWFYHGHENWKEGTFFIGYKGELALLDSGEYEDGGQDPTYYERTISANTMIIYDKDQVYQGWSNNDGGQCCVYRSGAEAYDYILPGTRWERPGITKFKSATTYDYMEADLAKNYNIEQDGTNINKLNGYTRNFIWLKGENPDNPGQGNYVVVFDKVDATNSAFKKRWLLHTIYRPELDGSENFIEGDISAGISESIDSSIATIESWKFGYGSSHMFCKTILPDNHITRIVGGPNYRFMDAEYVNHPLEKSSFIDYLGSWRIEVEPTVAQKEDLFLHVLYPCDAIVSKMPETVKITASVGNVVGTHIAAEGSNPGWVVMFNKTGGNVSEVTYSVSGQGALKQLICDLESGLNYNVVQDGNYILSKTSTDEGTLYFESSLTSTSVFCVKANPIILSASLASVTVAPNPFKPGRGDSLIRFTNLTGNPEIKIFTVSGELVKKITKQEIGSNLTVEWDVRNKHGEKVVSGVYPYLIINEQGAKKEGKIAIIK